MSTLRRANEEAASWDRANAGTRDDLAALLATRPASRPASRRPRSTQSQRLEHAAVLAEDAGFGAMALSLRNIGQQIDTGSLNAGAAKKLIRQRGRQCGAGADALLVIAADLKEMADE